MSEEKFFALISKLVEFAATIKTKNAFTPITWFCLIVFLCCFGCIPYVQDQISQRALVFFPMVVALLACFFYGYLMITDPKKLQSEEFQIKNQTLDLLSKKGEKNIPVSSVDLLKLSDHRLQETPKTIEHKHDTAKGEEA